MKQVTRWLVVGMGILFFCIPLTNAQTSPQKPASMLSSDAQCFEVGQVQFNLWDQKITAAESISSLSPFLEEVGVRTIFTQNEGEFWGASHPCEEDLGGMINEIEMAYHDALGFWRAELGIPTSVEKFNELRESIQTALKTLEGKLVLDSGKKSPTLFRSPAGVLSDEPALSAALQEKNLAGLEAELSVPLKEFRPGIETKRKEFSANLAPLQSEFETLQEQDPYFSCAETARENCVDACESPCITDCRAQAFSECTAQHSPVLKFETEAPDFETLDEYQQTFEAYQDLFAEVTALQAKTDMLITQYKALVAKKISDAILKNADFSDFPAEYGQVQMLAGAQEDENGSIALELGKEAESYNNALAAYIQVWNLYDRTKEYFRIPPVRSGGILPGPGRTESGTRFIQEKLIPKFVNGSIVLLFGLSTFMIIIGGITYLVSGGDQETVKKAKDIIIWALIGTVISVLAFAIVKFVVGIDFYG